MRASFLRRPKAINAGRAGLSRPPALSSPPLVNLAGRSVGLSASVPVLFDTPLAAHHRLIGRWANGRDEASALYSRDEARRYIERVFEAAVLEILKPLEIVDYSVGVLLGDDVRPPALAVSCETVGQLDMGWIEKSNVLSNTLFGGVAPVGWRATAYKAIVETRNCALPAFDYNDLFEEVSVWYWEGSANDEDATRFLVDMHGADPADLGEYALPSTMNARRPDWMLTENAVALKRLPKSLAEHLRRLKKAADALKTVQTAGVAWRFDFDEVAEYLPHLQDAHTLPPMTIVPVEIFGREIDDIARHGMEYGFIDVMGLCPLTDPAAIDAWLASLRIGVEYLLRLQELINLDPKDM